MNKSALNMIGFAFLFLFIDFRIQGFDILPDLVGYIMFAYGTYSIMAFSGHFKRAFYISLPLLAISLTDLYQRPSNENLGPLNLGSLGLLSIPLALVTIALSIAYAYYLFQGIIDVAYSKGLVSIAEKAGSQWRHYLFIQLATLLAPLMAFIPVIGIGYIIALMVIYFIIICSIMRFMNECGDTL